MAAINYLSACDSQISCFLSGSTTVKKLVKVRTFVTPYNCKLNARVLCQCKCSFPPLRTLMFCQFQIRLFFLIWLKAPKPLPHQGACYMKDLLLFQGEKRILLQV